MGVHAVLERTPSLAGVEAEILSSLAEAAVAKHLSRHQRLWDAGDTPRSFAVVKSGVLKVVRVTPGGRSVICGLFGAPDSVGDLALLKGVPYPAAAVAVTDSVDVLLIPRERVLWAMHESRRVADALVVQAQSKVENLLHRIDVLTAGSVESRLAALLLSLYDRFGDDFDDGSSSVPIHLSRQELAELVGTSTETAIRVMKRWERAGTVGGAQLGFLLKDLPTLRSLAGRS